jgi:membrane-associated protein
MEFLQFLRNLLDPNWLEAQLTAWGWLGYPILTAIVFAETGLLVGFFLPGDSLLFIAGFVASRGILDLFWLNLLLMVAAIGGDAVNYMLGRKTGEGLHHWEHRTWYRRMRIAHHIRRTHEFYEKHGGKTIILARFIPIIRTFAPFVAGTASMSYRRFALFNVVGGIGWVLLMTVAGYLLGNIPIVKRNFETAVLLIVFLSILPLLREVWLLRRRKKDAEPESGPVA